MHPGIGAWICGLAARYSHTAPGPSDFALAVCVVCSLVLLPRPDPPCCGDDWRHWFRVLLSGTVCDPKTETPPNLEVDGTNSGLGVED